MGSDNGEASELMATPVLDYITVKGFKSSAAIARVVFRPIHVLIGANGSGKSHFIGVFTLLHAIREGRLQEYVTKAGGADKLLHFGVKATPSMEVLLSFRNEVNQYSIKLAASDADELFPAEE